MACDVLLLAMIWLCCGYYLLKRKLTIEDSLVEKDPKSPHVNFCCDLRVINMISDIARKFD